MELVTPKLLEAPFVSHDAGVLAGAVVLRPSTLVDRLVPIQGEPSPIGERAIEQHGILVRTLRDRGVAVTVLDPVLGSPGEALVGDLAIVLPQGAIIARPAAVERRAETATIEAALGGLGVPILGRIAAPGLLDAADVTLAGEIVYVGVPRAGAGLRARSNALGRSQLGTIAAAQGLRLIELALAPSVLRLRNVFSFVGRDMVVVAPGRVDTAPLSGLQLIEVPLGEEYAAGILAIGERRVIANLRFRESLAQLRKAKVGVEAIDLWEFGKAGAGPFALVLATKRR
jgi:dimethylargininase